MADKISPVPTEGAYSGANAKEQKQKTLTATEQIDILKRLVSVTPFLKAMAALVLLHLFVKTLDMEDPDGQLQITHRQLQNLTGLSAPAVISAMKDLTVSGIITVEACSGRKSKAYRIVMPDDAGILRLMRRRDAR